MSQPSDNKRAITVGIFLFLGIVIFLVGVFTLGGQKKTFVKSFGLNVVFDDIQDILFYIQKKLESMFSTQ